MEINSIINFAELKRNLSNFKKKQPFHYCIIDNFFKIKYARQLESEIPRYNENIWHEYNNPIEHKRLTNIWNYFKPLTYQVFLYLTSYEFTKYLEKNLKINKLISDPGLHGGGIHVHKNGGKLNPHLDYFIHPKLKQIRKLNILIYLSEGWKPVNGGHLGFWEKNKDNSLKLCKEFFPKFNRAIIFDTTQNSWHGLSRAVKCNNKQYRKHFAVYYLIENKKSIDGRKKALFAPTPDQKNNKKVQELIKKRADEKWEKEKKKIDKKRLKKLNLKK